MSKSCQPSLEIPGDELVVVQLGVRGMHAVDLLRLAGTQPFLGVEAPGPFKQALATKDFMAAGDAAPEVVGNVEEGGIAVGDLAGEGENIAVDGIGTRRPGGGAPGARPRP